MRDAKFPVTSRKFGVLSDKREVTEYTLKNRRGMTVKVLDYGGIITELHVPDRKGFYGDVVLGFDSLEQYEQRHPYFGAIVGRYANRVAGGKFTVDGVEYSLIQNSDDHHLHGGEVGFDKVIWQASTGGNEGETFIRLSYLSTDGEEGYPGNLAVEVTYTLKEDNDLKVGYRAVTDKKTIVNLTQHTYFNLSAGKQRDILSHDLQINADRILELDRSNIPTGRVIAVDESPFDFRTLKPLGQEIEYPHEQLQIGNGYDHLWVLGSVPCNKLCGVAVLQDRLSGRKLQVSTTEPGLQLYTANHFDPAIIGKQSVPYGPRAGLCLETQKFPNSPNQPNFPTALLNPGEEFCSETVFSFSTVS